MLRTEELEFQYNPGEDPLVFPNISLEKSEEHLLILGKSGKGKTTLLHLLAGLLKPSAGKIFLDDFRIDRVKAAALDAFRGKNIGLVFQKNYALDSLTVLEQLQARLFFAQRPQNRAVIDHILQELDMSAYRDRKINQLSQGQLQRLAIALSVIHKPKLILADEPSSSLDDENCTAVIELLKQQALKTGAHLVVVTHDQRIKGQFQKTMSL